MKYFSSILAFVVLSLGVGALVAQAQQAYTPLAPLPGTVTSAGTTDIVTYLSGAIKLLIALGAALAVLFAIIGGTQYVAASINPSAKSDAKERVAGALLGLAIILSSYLLLNTINPELVNVSFKLEPVTPAAVDLNSLVVAGGGGSSSAQNSESAGCPSCVTLNPSVPQKAPGSGCAAPGPCEVSSSISGKLVALTGALNSKGINWQVSEAWPPTRQHKAACQNPGPTAGTCVDASLLSERTPSNISSFWIAASDSGLRAVYEVPTEARKLELLSKGLQLSNTSLIVVAGITGEHFSVYNK